MKQYDHIIVGTGQAAGTLLGKLIPSGDSIAVLEGGQIGGSCVNYGCTPTKTLVASAKAIHQAGRGAVFGFEAEPAVNFERIMARMNEIRTASSEGLTKWMQDAANVDLIRGFGKFTDSKTLQVNGEKIAGDKIYINVGTRPSLPSIDGLDTVNWLDSAGILELTDLPTHLVILGGGYIGCEYAQIFVRLGSEVTIIQRGSQLLPREDSDIAESVTEALKKEGVKIHCDSAAVSAHQNGSIALKVNQPGKTLEVEGSHLLVAAGRIPNSDKLDLESAGISVNEQSHIVVNDYCETEVEGVYALGDVNGHGGFTHTAVNDAQIVLDHLNGGTRKISDRVPVYALFTDPPLGRVGMSEEEALEKGYRVLRATKPMKEISRANEMGETHGLVKILVDGDTDLILGAAIHGVSGDEVINMFAAMMHAQIPCQRFREVVLVHPTVSELMPFVLEGLEEVDHSNKG